MTIKLGMILLGSLLLYAGWKNLSAQALIFGDNQSPKSSSGWQASSPLASTGDGSAAAVPSGRNGTAAAANAVSANNPATHP